MKQNSTNVKEKKFSKIAFSHVGCEKNLVDTEHMQGLLDKEGYEVDSNINDANVVVVNTCSFIETANISFADEYDLYGEIIKIL